MKNLVLTIAAVVIAVLIFALYPFEPPPSPELQAENSEREALKAIPDKKVSLAFEGVVSGDGDNGKAETQKVSGSVSMTVTAWEHAMLKQKPGMTKYKVPGSSFQLTMDGGSLPLTLSGDSELTMEIINGVSPSTDDYFLLELSNLASTDLPGSQTTLRIQLHDKSGKAFSEESLPSDIALNQWNSKTLTVNREFADGSANKNPKAAPERQERPDRRRELALFGNVESLNFSSN